MCHIDGRFRLSLRLAFGGELLFSAVAFEVSFLSALVTGLRFWTIGSSMVLATIATFEVIHVNIHIHRGSTILALCAISTIVILGKRVYCRARASTCRETSRGASGDVRESRD